MFWWVFFNVYNGIPIFPFLFFFFFFCGLIRNCPVQELNSVDACCHEEKKLLSFFFETSLWFHSQWKLKQKHIYPLNNVLFFCFVYFLISKNRIKLKYDGESKINKILLKINFFASIWENDKHQQEFIPIFSSAKTIILFFLLLVLVFKNK